MGHSEKEEQVGFMDHAAKKENCCTKMCGSVRGLLHFMYNPKTHLVMGRNCKQWAQLLAFYGVFYTCLIGFWIACLMGFLATTSINYPVLQGYQSLLQLNPAMGYRPQPDSETNLIKFNSTNNSTYKVFLDDATSFLSNYLNDTYQSALIDCSKDGKASATAACKFDPRSVAPRCFQEPSPPYKLGFDTGNPCIILKMNRIYGWLPSNVVNTTASNTTAYQDVKVRCRGENPADDETIGEIEYYPGGKDQNGAYGLISAKYFPFMNQPQYLSPLVFARFAKMRKYTMALIWCQFDAEAMNFVPDAYWTSMAPTERAGGVHFELVIDYSTV